MGVTVATSNSNACAKCSARGLAVCVCDSMEVKRPQAFDPSPVAPPAGITFGTTVSPMFTTASVTPMVSGGLPRQKKIEPARTPRDFPMVICTKCIARVVVRWSEARHLDDGWDAWIVCHDEHILGIVRIMEDPDSGDTRATLLSDVEPYAVDWVAARATLLEQQLQLDGRRLQIMQDYLLACGR